jgi:hypothetical protein
MWQNAQAFCNIQSKVIISEISIFLINMKYSFYDGLKMWVCEVISIEC